MSSSSNIKKLKVVILQYEYRKISDLIIRLEKHVNNLYLNNIIDTAKNTQIMGQLYNLSKSLNVYFNDYIVEKLDYSDHLNTILVNLVDLFTDEDSFFNRILPIIKNSTELPLFGLEKDIIDIMSDIGYDNLKELLSIYGNKFNLSKDQTKLIDEVSVIFVPTKINYFKVANHNEDYYWRLPTTFSNSDVLELTRELWIKNTIDNTEYIKVEGFFINDTLSCFIKTCQLKYPILYESTKDLINKAHKLNISNSFTKKMIRYDYLGNIYCLSHDCYLEYLLKSFNKSLELYGSSFMNIMKDFVSKDTSIKKMYEYIFFLLLGNSNNVDIAGLLLNLVRDRKTNKTIIYNIIYQRLPYYLLLKIKKSSNNLKQELDRIKTVTTQDIDYKKILISNKDIPPYVKSLTLEKIEEMKNFNNEYYKQLTFVKSILNFPWPSPNDDLFFKNINSDISVSSKYLMEIENKLKELSYGHEEAKKILLQTIGKWISNPSSQGACIGLVGPPGVGKTLLAKSVGKALNIPFSEITLGGQNDGELLHGHGYTYSGSQPGLIIKKIIEMGKPRCILYFDELDKACSKNGSTNEITSILIHLTDPNMNKTFQDRFFQGIDFPLDKVIIIFSYNDPSTVDPILLDRITQIEISPYTTEDKVRTVRDFIIPEVIKSIGLDTKLDQTISIDDSLIEYIIENYTSEAGVRSIKRKIEQIFLTLNLERYRENGNTGSYVISITKDLITKILGESKQDHLKIHSKPCVGIVNGLYATSNGDGGIIPIQVFNNFSPNINHYEIKLTGKQGEVMRESVHCSLTVAIDYIRRNISQYPIVSHDNIDNYLINNFRYGFHVHAPYASIPKDGPSAGCAFTCAFISRILNIPIKNNIAMTGEVELTGRVTKIGGLNYKLIGAKKSGVNIVYIPKDNERDLNEIKKKYPNLINENFKVLFFEYIDDIIIEILVN